MSWVLMLGIAVVGSNSLALSPILADVARDLDATPVQVARAGAAYGAATALSALLLGPQVDRRGAKPTLVLGLAALMLALLASAASTHWVVLAAAQAVAGAAAGVVLPATYALATAAAPEGRGAVVLGRVLTGWSVSLVAGVPLSSALAGAASWRASYLALCLPLLLSAWLVSRLPLPAGGRRPGPGNAYRGILRGGTVPSLLGICLLFMTAFYGVYAYLGDHARASLGISAAEAGLVVLAYGVGFGLATAGDRLIDRLGSGRLFPGVLAGVALVYAALPLAMSTYAGLLALSAAWGFVNHFGLNILVLRLGGVDPGRRGALLALNSAVTYAGASVGVGLFGVLYEGAGFGPMAGAASALAACAALLALRIAPTRQPCPTP